MADKPAAVLVAVAVVVPIVVKAVGLLDAWTSVVFWIAVALGIVLVVTEVSEPRTVHDGAGDVALVGPLLVLVLSVPVVFDPRLLDAFAAPRLAIVAPGGIGLAAAWLLRSRAWPLRWRNGAHWPALALLVWSTLSGIAAGSLGLSLIGADLSADGLLVLGGCVGLFFAVAGGLELVDVWHVVRVLVLGTGGIVVLYGLVQLHDRVWGGSWDWAPWAASSFSGVSIWSTLGNPNHLAGFLACIVPLGVVILIVERRQWARVLGGVVTALAMVEIVQAAARGGWVATAAGVGVLGVFITIELGGRARAAAVAGGLLLAAVAGGVALGSHTTSLGSQLRSIVQFNDHSTNTERLHYWHASVELGLDHPLVGVGPDGFRFAFPSVQQKGYVDAFGPEQVANGPHNMFLNQLATTGVPGLVALVALFGAVGARGIGAWRRLRAAGADARRERLLLGGLVSSGTAIVIQSAFNVQQVAITFTLWLVLGLILVFARATPSTWRPLALLRPDTVEERSARRYRPPAWLLPAGIAIAVVAVVAILPSSAPWRGDVAYARSISAQRKGAELARQQSADANEWFGVGTKRLEDAIDANPWRARYRELRASGILDLAQNASAEAAGRSPSTIVELAIGGFRHAVSIEPDNARLREGLADAYVLQSTVGGGDRAAEAAVTQYQRSLRRNPWVGRVRLKLSRALIGLQRADDAIEELTVGLHYNPGADVYRGLALSHAALADGEAERWWRKTLEVAPGDPEALAAIQSGS